MNSQPRNPSSARRRPAPLFMASLAATLLLLAGCSSVTSLWEEVKSTGEERFKGYVEPKPGRSVSLKRTWKSSVTSSTPKYLHHPGVVAVSGGDVFVASQQGDVARVSRTNGDVLWKKDLDTTLGGGVAVSDSLVFVGTLDGEMVALSRSDGSVAWRQGVGAAVASAAAVARDRVVFQTLDNRTHALDLASGRRLWQHATLPETMSLMGAGTPTIAGEFVLVGYSSGELFALNLGDGRKVWSDNLTVLGGRTELELVQDVDAPIVVVGNRIYTVSHQGNLVVYAGVNGTRQWERTMSSIRRPLVASGRVFVSDMEGWVYAFDDKSGAPVWRTRVSDGLLTNPLLLNGQILVADHEGRFASLDPNSGQVEGFDHLKENIFSEAVAADGSLFLWTDSGNLWRFQ